MSTRKSLYETDAVMSMTYPGSRVLSLSQPDEGNFISEQVLSTIKDKLDLYRDNHTVGAIFVTSYSPVMFSAGLEPLSKEDKAGRRQLVLAANEVARDIEQLGQATVAVFSGQVDACAFAVFGLADYRLGTGSTQFRVNDLFAGRLPLGGALAHHLSRSGYAMARYLAVSGRTLTAHDMFVLGLLTHIVEEQPHLTLADALAHTVPTDDDRKAVQSSAVDASALSDLLDSMHIYMQDDSMDVLSHPVWDKVMLVTPQPIPVKSFFESEEAQAREEDLEDVSTDIVHCFSSDDVAECRRRTQQLATEQQAQQQRGEEGSSWAVRALQAWDEIEPALVQDWFMLTKAAAAAPIAKVYMLEEGKA